MEAIRCGECGRYLPYGSRLDSHHCVLLVCTCDEPEPGPFGSCGRCQKKPRAALIVTPAQLADVKRRARAC